MKRGQFTIRAPKELLEQVREEAVAYGASMNDLVVAAVEKEISIRKRLRLLDQIDRERQAIERRGTQPDSTPLIRQIRLGGDRRD